METLFRAMRWLQMRRIRRRQVLTYLVAKVLPINVS